MKQEEKIELAKNPVKREEWLKFFRETDPVYCEALDLAKSHGLSASETDKLAICILSKSKIKEI